MENLAGATICGERFVAMWAEVIELTPAQWAVVEWLARHPNIYVTENDGHPMWSARWRDEDARRHMIAVCDRLAPFAGDLDAAGHTSPADLRGGGTPRLTAQTWRALKRRGIVQARWYELRQPPFTPLRYRYQLAPHVDVEQIRKERA